MKQRVRTKICGLTRVEDAQAAVAAGADAVGLVFYPPSPRNLAPQPAAELVQQLAPFVTSVGLFVNPTASWVEEVLKLVPLDLLQFHGDEPEDFCISFGRPYIKALRMHPELNPDLAAANWPQARGILLDAYQPGVPGGTGAVFDWQRFPTSTSSNWILAGGLTPTNVAAAIQATRPYAVDVSGGVESFRGIKCPTKIQAFVQAVNN